MANLKIAQILQNKYIREYASQRNMNQLFGVKKLFFKIFG